MTDREPEVESEGARDIERQRERRKESENKTGVMVQGWESELL